MLKKRARCIYCNKKIEWGISYCNKCGKNVSSMWEDPLSDSSFSQDTEPKYCPNCKAFVGIDDGSSEFPLFCMSCGYDFSKNSPKTKEELENSVNDVKPHISTGVMCCPSCGREAEEGQIFCDICGCDFRMNPLVEKKDTPRSNVEICFMCGKNVAMPGDKLCESCRAKMDSNNNMVSESEKSNFTSKENVSTTFDEGSDDIFNTFKSKAEEIHMCSECHKNRVEKDGDICEECMRNKPLRYTGGSGFHSVKNI